MFIAGIIMQLLFLAALVGGAYLLYQAITGSESDSDDVTGSSQINERRNESPVLIRRTSRAACPACPGRARPRAP